MKKNNDERERKKFFSTELKFLKIKIISKKENNETICFKIIIITKTKMGENIAGRIKSSESEHTARTLFSPIKRRNLKIEFLFFYFFRLKPLSLSFLLLPPSHTHTQLTPFPLLSLYRKKNKIGLGLWLFAFYIIKNKPSVTCVYINGNPNSLYTPAPLKENKTKKKLRFISSSSCISYFLSLSVCVSASEGSDPTD